MCDRTVQFPPTPLSFLLKCLEICKQQVKADPNVGNKNKLREWYALTLSRFGKVCDDLWLEYIDFENENREFKKAASLYWKAKKIVANPTQFVRKSVERSNGDYYQQLQQSFKMDSK